jgi:hypothetical protein
MTLRDRAAHVMPLSGRAMKSVLPTAAFFCVLIFSASTVRGGEQDDIETQIYAERAIVADLEHLDEQHVVGPDIKVLKAWLDDAWSLRMLHDYDRAHEVFDRTFSQEELIRQEIATSKLAAEAKRHEVVLQGLRLSIARARSALQKVKTNETTLGTTTR